MDSLQKFAPVIGRIFIAIPFLLAGFGKFTDPAMNGGYMDAYGVPTLLLYPAALVEFLGAIALIVGFKARWAALILAGFTAIATIIFHNFFADPTQMIVALKNIAIIGALLYIFAFGPGRPSIDKA